MEDMINIITSHVKLNLIPHVYDYKNRILSEFRISNVEDMFNLGKWMYKDSHVFLNRKYESFVKFMDKPNEFE